MSMASILGNGLGNMFRLAMALAVAYMLLPAERDNFSTQTPKVVTAGAATPSEVTAFDGMAAAQEIYSDLSMFCQRNEKTCDTAKKLALQVDVFLSENLDKLGKSSKSGNPVAPDQVTTSSIN